MFISKKKLTTLIDKRVEKYINDSKIDRFVAMEYLVSLKKTHLNRFMEAVDLRRQSEEKLDKLDEVAPDVDNISQELLEV